MKRINLSSNILALINRRNNMKDFEISDFLCILAFFLIISGAAVFYSIVLHPEEKPDVLKSEPIPIVVEDKTVPTEEEIEEVKLGEPEEPKAPILSDEEIIAMVVDIEAGVDADMIAKVAVASVVLNRCDSWGMTVESVIYQKDQFAIAKSYTADDLRAVEIAQETRDLFPSNMLYFRNKHYHSFGVPYMEIGGNYFSLSESEETE